MNFNQRYLLEEWVEEYKANRYGRRELLRRAVLVTGSVPVAAAALFALGCGSSGGSVAPTATQAPAPTPAPVIPTPPPASGPGVTVQPSDPAIIVQDVKFKGPASDMIGYLSQPRAAGSYPGVIVIHENRGLLEHFKDVTRRYAKENFVALAIDLLSRQGGTPADPTQAASMLARTSPDDAIADMKSAVDYLKTRNFVRAGAYGVTGFCMGGNFTWDLAVASPDMKAAVPYYGRVRTLDQLSQIRAAVLAIYGGADNFVTPQSVQVEEGLRGAGKPYEIKIYEGAQHAFFNDTSGSYNMAAAQDAWPKTLAWFRKYLTA